MKKIVLTTKKYYSFFYQLENSPDCDWVDFNKHFLDYFAHVNYTDPTETYDSQDILGDFFALKPDTDNEAEEDFWAEDKLLKIIKFSNDNCELYILPCVPKYRLETFSKNRLTRLQRQNYVGNYIKNILDGSSNSVVNKENLYVVVHDRDIFNDTVERIMTEEDVEEDSVLSELVSEDKLSPINIFGFKHAPTESEMFNTIMAFLDDHNLDKFLSSIIDTIETEQSILLY